MYFTEAIETYIFTATPRMEVNKHFSPKTLFDLLPSLRIVPFWSMLRAAITEKTREAHYEVVASRAEVT